MPEICSCQDAIHFNYYQNIFCLFIKVKLISKECAWFLKDSFEKLLSAHGNLNSPSLLSLLNKGLLCSSFWAIRFVFAMIVLSFSASSHGEHESGHWHSLAEFTASHAHFLTKASAASKSLQSCLTLCNPMDSSPSGHSVHGILQARILEWVAISFSN